MRKFYSAVSRKSGFFALIFQSILGFLGLGNTPKQPGKYPHFYNLKKVGLVLTSVLLAFCLQAQVTITPATNGTSISADRSANATAPGFTVLGNIQIQETGSDDFATDVTQLVLNAPVGWVFNTSGVSVNVTGIDITAGTIVYGATTITIPLTVGSIADVDLVSISNVSVQAVDGAVLPSAGNVTASFTGTINGITTSTNLGALSQDAGNASQLAITTQPASTIYGTAIGTSTVVTQDQFGNLSTTGLAATENITAAITTGNGTLGGTTTQNIGTGGGNGTVSFAGLLASNAGTKIVTFSGTGLTAALSNSFDVNQAPLTITATGQSKIYGITLALGNSAFTSTGLLNGETTGTVTLTSAGAINTANAGTYAIVPSAATGGTFTASNYDITYVDGTLTVDPASLTITSDDRTKTYGATLAMGTTAFTSTGLANGETIGGVTLTSAGAINTANIGTYPVVASTATGGTFTASNYNINYVNGTLTVDLATLTITSDNRVKTYGATLALGTTAFTSTGLLNGETIGNVTLTSAGTINTANAGNYPILASAATGGTFTASNYNITYVNGTLTVDPAALTITADNRTKIYGATLAMGTTAFTSTGLVNGETIGGVTLTSAGAINTANVNSYPVIPSAASGGTFNPANYTITYVNGSLAVGAAPLTITANDRTKTYGATLAMGTTAFTSAGLLNGETIANVTLTSAGSINTANVASYPVIPSAATGGTFNPSNYTITYVNGTLVVGTAPLTITANARAKSYGTALVMGTTAFTSTGLVNSETIGGVTLTSAGAVATANVGAYPVIPSAATGGTFNVLNYTITYTNGTLTVGGSPLTITAIAQGKTYGTTLALGTSAFTATGLLNGETVGSVTLTSAGAVNTANVGGYPIVPSAATGGTFNAANYTITYTNGTLTVSTAPLSIVGNDRSKVFGTTLAMGTTLFTATGLQNGQTIGSVTLNSAGAINTANVGTYAITPSAASGGTFTASNYSITYITTGLVTVTPATLTITANAQSKVYGTTLAMGTTLFTPVGLQNGNSIGGVTLTSTGSVNTAVVGTYPIVISAATGGSFIAANYTITYVNGTLTVTKAVPAITLVSSLNPACFGSSVTFTATLTPTSAAVTGQVQFFDGATSLGTVTLAGNIASVTTSALTAATHSITVVYAGDANYNTNTSSALSQIVYALPVTTGAVICQGLTGTLTSSSACAAPIAGSQGANLPASGVSSGTNTAWTNPGRITAIDNSRATVSLSGGFTANNGATQTLSASQFGFSIPAAAVITDIKVEIDRSATGGTGVQDQFVQLIKGGTITGSNLGLTAVNWPTTDAVQSYAGSPAVWGVTLTPADVNAANFGTALKVDISAPAFSTRAAQVDYIQITITYSIPGSLNWYTVSSGGTAIGNGSPFNPVGVAGSGLPNTNTPGTYTFYAECAAGANCRTATTFVINPLPTISGTLNICIAGTTQLTGSASPAASAPWVSGTPGVATVSNTGLVTGVSAGTSVITYKNTNGCIITATITVLQPVISGTLNVCPGATTQLTATGTPAASNPWVSSNTAVATISNTGLISGLIAGTTDITFTNSIGCTATVSVVVNADATITLTSAAATTSQVFCINTPITAITYLIGGGGTGANVTGLPSGVNGNYNAGTKVFTISGTPSVSGNFSYTVTTTGPCVKPALGGTITVQANSTITRTTNAASTSQTPCINTAINNIIYTIGGGATGANVTGLPTGVSGSLSGNTFTISGTPTVSGNFSYTVTATGPCLPASLSGTINVGADATIALNSAVATTGQTLCVNTPITAITYLIGGGGTGATITGFPAGISGSFNTTTKVYTISGSPTASGSFNFTVTASGPCLKPSLTGTMTVTPNSTITLTSGAASTNQEICTNTPITNITYLVGASATGATVTGLPTGVTGSYNSGTKVFTISGTPSVTNTFNYTVTTTGPCGNPSLTGKIVTLLAPIGTLTATENSGTANNDNIVCIGSSVTFTATAGFGAYVFKNGATTLQSGTSNIYSTSSLPIGTTNITVDVSNALNCGSTFGPVAITVNPLPVPTMNSSDADNIICSGDTVIFTAGGGTSYTFKVNGSVVQSSASNIYETYELVDQDVVTVDVSNANGCIATAAPRTITVNALPSGAVTPAAAEICSGAPVTFTAPVGFSSYTFLVDGVPVQGPNTTRTYTSTFTNPAIITVNATNAAGCFAVLDTIVVNVNALPSGILGATENSNIANDNSICAGTPVSFTATVGFAGYDFKINGASAQTGTSNTFSRSNLNNGDIITVDVSNGDGCEATFGPITITVVASPAGSLTVAPSASVCAGANASFTATSGAGNNYDFKVNGVTAQNGASNIFITNSLATNDIVTVEVTNSNACVTVFNPITMTISPAPTTTLTAVENSGNTPDDGIICAGASITFTAPAGFTNYNFLRNGISVQNGASRTYVNAAVVTGQTFQVAVTNAGGCIGISNTITATVNPLPPAVNPITGTLSTCVNTTTNLATTTTGGVWSSSNDAVATVDAAGQVAGISAGTAIITYTVTNANGCVQTATATVTINALPVVAVITGANGVCIGNTITLANATTGGVWSSDNGPVATINPSTGVVSGISNGTALISYTVTNGNGCSTTVTKSIAVNTLPVVGPITVVAPATTFDVCVGSTINITNATPGGTWFIIGAPGVAAVNSAGLVTGLGDGTTTIRYRVTNGNGCVADVTVDVNVHALPVPTLTGANPICPGSTETYTTEAGETNYVWNFTGGTLVSGGTATDNTITITWGAAAVAKSINVNYTNSFGCSGATSATLATSTGTVPTLTGVTPVCLNDIQIYTTQSGQQNYTWIVNGGTITSGDGTEAVTVNWTTPGNGSISVNFEDFTGCTSANPTVKPVLVNNNPIVVTHDQAVCDPNTANLTIPAVTAGSSGGLTLSYWQDAAASIPYTTPTTAPAGTYYIKGTFGSGCFTITRVDVTSSIPPSATIAYAASPYCSTVTNANVSLTGTTGGTYSSTTGLTINASTGAINPSTSTAGTYTVAYTVAPSGGCTIYTTTAAVTITAAPSATIAYTGTPFCTSSAVVNVTRTGTAGGNYSAPAGLTIDPVTGAITPATSTGGTYTVTYQVVAANGCAQFTTTTSVTITLAPAATIAYAASPFCANAAVQNVTFSGTAGGSYTSTSGLSINPSTGAITATSSTPGTYTVTYSITGTGGCANFSTTASVTITPVPTASINYGATSFCVSVVGAQAVTLTGTGAYTGGTYAAVPAGLTINSATGAITPSTSTPNNYTITYTIPASNGCGTVAVPRAITISAVPASFVITPASGNICLGDVQPLLASATAPTTGTLTFPSGTINRAIPDAQDFFFFVIPGSVTTNLAVAGIPAGAVINSMSVNFNINHTYDQDLVINLRGPNGVINLVNRRGGSANNFVNTTISSTGVTPVNSVGAPFTGTYSADAANNVGTPTSNVTAFSSLYGASPNGTWTFGVEDDADGDQGTIVSWSLTFNYTVAGTPITAVWTPSTGLYTDPGGTVAYTGTALSTVYSKPATTGTITYTATTTNGAGCTASKTVAVTTNAVPVVSITSDYCIVPGKVRLTASSVPAATSYVWSTGATTASIDVDIAGSFDVTAFGATSCPGKASINVANELIVNGNFEAGNVGFVSTLPYRTGAGSLNNPPGYTVDTAANYYGPSFLWGKDHTTGHGKFMMVNGQSTRIWEQTLTVQPNTTYYFSAWGLELDNLSGNPANAILQFNVNGVNTGTLANLPRPPANVNRDQDNNQWVRFYGSWTSGPTTTTAVVRINDLENAAYGNNFGLDDISFGSLSTFITLESPTGTDAQTVCRNTPITNIQYNVGNGSTTGPNVAGLPAGVTSSFSGDLLTITGTPTAVGGTYTYTITTTGTCNPISKTGTITVQAPTVTLTSGSTNTNVCQNVSMSKTYTLGGTATGVTITGLPTGISFTVSGTTLTISGTTIVAPGLYPYTITTTGGTCTQVTLNGSITVQGGTIVLSSAAGTDAQPAVCINTPIVNIRYQIGGTATGATITGLPTGLTVSPVVGGFITISGSPSQSGTFSYTVSTTGGTCAGATKTGTITVTPAAAIALTSGAIPSSCFNTPIAPITYAVTNATNASVTSGTMPAGVTGSFSGGVFTISGTPTVGGTFNFTITTTGGCATATISGTLVIQSQTITLTSGAASPSLCANTTMTSIVYTFGGTATGATQTGLPAGITMVISGSTITLSGSPTDIPGSYPYTITTTGTCNAATATGTITISPTAIGGTIASIAVCDGGSGSLTLTGQTGTITRWEFSTNGGTTWTPIANTTITQAYTNITVPTLYRVVITNGCGPVFSTAGAVNVHNYWTGATSTDWNDATNWSDGLVPSTICPNVTIPAVPTQPTLVSGTSTITNLIVQPGAMVTVTGGVMQIGGTVTSTGGFNVSTGTVVFNGTTAQAIAGTMFAGGSINNLTLSNPTGLTISNVGAPVSVSGTVAFGSVNNAVINTGNNFVLTSTATGTARVADVTNNGVNNNNRFNGIVTVERYFPARRSWRLFTAPVSAGGPIFDNWQNGGVFQAGKGTYVTGTTATAPTGANGLDWSPLNNSSLKETSALTPVMNTHLSLLSKNLADTSDNIPYFIFVRGDRLPSNTSPSQSNTTTLSSKGRLQTGRQTFSVTPTLNAFTLIGNPYASPVDFGKLIRANVAKRLYVWDPYLNAEQGGYITIDDPENDGIYSYSPMSPGGLSNILQSGQAFFVQTATNNPGSVIFGETAKSATPTNLTAFRPTAATQSLRMNLYNVAADKDLLLDGTLVEFNEDFDKTVDNLDALKFGNVKEMLALTRDTKNLSLERRPAVTTEDTLYLRLTKTTQRSYRFEFLPTKMDPSLTAFLEDSYKGTKTELSVTTKTLHDFAVNGEAASAAPNRFSIVFKKTAPVVLPVTYKRISAKQQDADIAVEWTVENEINISKYEIEKSTDAINFTKAGVTDAKGANRATTDYQWLDKNPVSGNNYYRVRSISFDGKYDYTNVVVVNIIKGNGGIRIYPNPVTNGIIGAEFKNMANGIYKARLLNATGQTIFTKLINHAAGTSMENIRPDYRLPAGIYQMEVTAPDNIITMVKVIIK